MTAADGILARRLMRSDHAAGNLGDAIPSLFRSAGFIAHRSPRIAIGASGGYVLPGHSAGGLGRKESGDDSDSGPR